MNFDDMTFADVVRLEKKYGATLGSASTSKPARAKKGSKGKGRASKLKLLPPSVMVKKQGARTEIPVTIVTLG